MSETAEKIREQDLQDRSAAAQERVDELVAEAQGLGAKERETQAAGDVDGVEAVRRRGKELPKELRHAKADVQDALANLEAHRAAENAEAPEMLARVDLLDAEIEKLKAERGEVLNEIGSKRYRRDQHTARQTEHRHEARRLRQEGIEWG